MSGEAAANANYGSTASGSSFYAAMRILPSAQREAMFQIYSFCRQVDDIADSDGPRAERLAALVNGNALLELHIAPLEPADDCLELL